MIHNLNLGLRFLLELAALGAVGWWAWRLDSGWRWPLVVLLPLLLATIWGTFRVPGDPNDAPVAVRGTVRLAIEALVFGAALVGLWLLRREQLALAFAGVLLLHYVVDWQRVRWLLTA